MPCEKKELSAWTGMKSQNGQRTGEPKKHESVMHHLNSRSVLEHVNYRESHAHVEMTNARGDDEWTEMHEMHECEQWRRLE